MTYATQADLVERYGESMLRDLTDRADPPAGAIDGAVVSRALADTDAAIDGYLVRRYVLPLPSVPPLLRDVALSIAIYKLHRDITSEKIRNDYVDAVKTLNQIAGGTVQLSIDGAVPAGSGADGVVTTDRVRPLTYDSLKGFI